MSTEDDNDGARLTGVDDSQACGRPHLDGAATERQAGVAIILPHIGSRAAPIG